MSSSWRPTRSSCRSRSRPRSSSRRRRSARCWRCAAPRRGCGSSPPSSDRSRPTPSAGRRCASGRRATGAAGPTRRSSRPRDHPGARRGADRHRGRTARPYGARRTAHLCARRPADAPPGARRGGAAGEPGRAGRRSTRAGGAPRALRAAGRRDGAVGRGARGRGRRAAGADSLEPDSLARSRESRGGGRARGGERSALRGRGGIVELGSPGGEPWGPDVVGLFVGSEGNFGIATRIAVRLLPLPRAVRTLLAAFASLRSAGEAVSAVIASGIVPAALEMMDQSCIRAVEDSVYAAGYPRDAAAVLLVELDGHSDDAVAADSATVQDLLAAHGAASIRVAADTAERERLWQGRKKALGAMGRLSRDLVVQDAVVPRSALPDVLATIGRVAPTYPLTVSNVFHAGDGNLHPNISFDAPVPGLRTP